MYVCVCSGSKTERQGWEGSEKVRGRWLCMMCECLCVGVSVCS